ncbi:MAG TPA: HNH endonuclease signature motif containing protein [Planctomycetota bacterium]|nr:HNH endonuclease signature motif containing protein [Planctomycetota bacterium]
MSTNRISPDAGRVDPSLLPRGPGGRCLCRQCGQEVPKGRRTFCSDACVDGWRVKTDPAYLRSLVWKRDRGRCASCGLRCKDLEKSLTLLSQVLSRLGASGVYGSVRKAMKVKNRHSFWDADHIRAVADGGGECGVDNIQTLCIWCHREKTAVMRRPTMASRA